MQMHMMMLVLAMATGINLSTGSATASERDDGTTVEIARGVRMPFVSDGIILDTAKNGTGEVKGLELWMQQPERLQRSSARGQHGLGTSLKVTFVRGQCLSLELWI